MSCEENQNKKLHLQIFPIDLFSLKDFMQKNMKIYDVTHRTVGAGDARAPPDFGRSVN